MKSSQKLFAAGIYQQLPEVEGRHGGSVRASQPAALGSNLDTPEIFWLEILDPVLRDPGSTGFRNELCIGRRIHFRFNKSSRQRRERGSGQMASISSRR